MTPSSCSPEVRRRFLFPLAVGAVFALSLGACGEGKTTNVNEGESSEAESSEALVVLNRPSLVPRNYVPTPNGWFHPDCVIEVSEDDTVNDDGTISNQSLGARRVQTCNTPRFDREGKVVVEGALAPPPTVDGWVASASTTSLGPIRYVHAQWTVPPAPKTRTGQVVYYFPGLESSTNVKSILQPVLGWNQGGIAGWTLASWNCCVSGTTQHTAFIKVTGSVVSGDIGGNNCNSAGVCNNWQIVSYDHGSQRSVTLNTTAFGVALNWIFGAAFEAYGVTSCNQYPGTSSLFSGFYINKAPSGAHVATPAWSPWVGSGLSPACGYSVSQSAAHDVTIRY